MFNMRVNKISFIGALILLFIAVSCNGVHPIPVSANELLFEREGGTEIVRCLEGTTFGGVSPYVPVPEDHPGNHPYYFSQYAEEDGYIFYKTGWMTLKFAKDYNQKTELEICIAENTTGVQRSCTVVLDKGLERVTINITQKK